MCCLFHNNYYWHIQVFLSPDVNPHFVQPFVSLFQGRQSACRIMSCWYQVPFSVAKKAMGQSLAIFVLWTHNVFTTATSDP